MVLQHFEFMVSWIFRDMLRFTIHFGMFILQLVIYFYISSPVNYAI